MGHYFLCTLAHSPQLYIRNLLFQARVESGPSTVKSGAQADATKLNQIHFDLT